MLKKVRCIRKCIPMSSLKGKMAHKNGTVKLPKVKMEQVKMAENQKLVKMAHLI